MFCVEILKEKLAKNVFFRVFQTKKPLKIFRKSVFRCLKDTSAKPKSISKCLIFTEIRALKGEILFFEKVFVFFCINFFHCDFSFFKDSDRSEKNHFLFLIATVASLRAKGAFIASSARYAGKQIRLLFARPGARHRILFCHPYLILYTFLHSNAEYGAVIFNTSFCRAN